MALALCLTLLPTAALAADGAQAADGTVHPSHTDATKLWMDGDTLKKGDNPWTAEFIEVWGTRDDGKETAYALTTGTYYLGNNIEITQYPIMITGNVTLCLNGKQITCGSSAPECVIGVYANAASELTLTDCGNTGRIAGGKNYGVKVYKGYTLNMYGGTITGGVDMSGNTEGSTTKFNMSGGTITGDGVGVKLTQYCEFTMSGGTISNNKGGVLTGGGTFTMTGGEISGNTATSNGGGVNIGNGGKFTMSGGEITGNTATSNGGGVNIGNGGKFTMSGGAISGNTAGYAGGGVYVSGGTFTMNGGEIKSNTAETNGGGVYVTKTASSSNSAFTMNGGEISGNTAKSIGGGVLVDNGTFTVSDKPIVSENTSESAGKEVTDNVYLPANKTITIDSGLTNGTDIGVTTGSAMAPTEDSTIAIATATENAHGYLSYFKSDNDSYEIVTNKEETQLVLKAKPRIDLTNSAEIKITSPSADLVYTGKPITVAYEVKYNNMPLEPGKDYTVTGNSGTDAKEYTLTIEGKGNYTGSVEKKWTITPLIVSVSSVTLKDKVYDGTTAGSSSDVTRVEVKSGSNNSVTLQKEDYTIGSVTYTNANAGTNAQNVKVEVTLQNGNYTFAGNTLTTQVDTQGKITKAPAPETVPYNLYVVNNKEDTYTLNLSELLPKLPDGCGYGTKKYGPVDRTFLWDNYNGGGIQLPPNGDTLTLPIKAANKVKDGEQIGTVTAKVKTQNYDDITLTINVIASDAEKTDPVYTAPTAKTLTYNGQAQKLINPGTVTEGGEMQYKLGATGTYSEKIPTATNAGDYTVYYKVVGDATHNNVAEQSIKVRIEKAQLSGTPTFTKVTTAGKTLKNVAFTKADGWPDGKFEWGNGEADYIEDAPLVQGQAYSWRYLADNYYAEGAVVLWASPTGGTTGGGSSSGGSSSGGSSGGSSSGGGGSSSSGGSGSSDSNPVIKTETKNNSDGSTTKTETRKDGSVTATTTGKDGSTSKTETKKDGSSVTENKAADGSTGTVKTDKNGKTEASAKLSAKAVEDAKKSGEPVKAPVEVEASRNSGAAPTVKVELPKNAGKTEVEIPVSNAKPGTVAVLVHADGTEEILKASVPTEGGIRLTVDGSATVKIVDNSKDFIDTRNHWAKDAIDFVSARGLVNGMNDSIYAPNNSTTRAQLWTILARQNDADLNGGNTWYEKAQLWSQNKGISDGTRPNADINRAQMVTMLWRTAGQPTAGGTANFTDVPADSYYAQAVAWAVENDITDGVGNGRFDPAATCTRAQIATFLARSMK